MKKFAIFFLAIAVTFLLVACNAVKPDDGGQGGNTEPPAYEPHVTHVDGDGDGRCDLCLAVMPKNECSVHMDDDGDGKCDICGKSLAPTHTVHMDDDEDGKCDICGQPVGGGNTQPPAPTHTVHMDDDEDGACDVCGQRLKLSADGWYTLVQKIEEGVDVTENYLLYSLRVEGSKATLYVTDVCGRTETAYDAQTTSDSLVLKQGFRTQSYLVGSDGSLFFDGLQNGKSVTLRLSLEKSYTLPADSGEVAFTGELFGDDINENFYNYCPTVMFEGNDVMHVWYCSNEISGNVTDHVAYRKGQLSSDGKWTFSEKKLVLSPSENTWDARHVCDPSVVKGKFAYKGAQYSYLMAYLGCESSDCTANEVGLAVANSPEGPWVKYEGAFCNFHTSVDYTATAWGYGQPSLVSVDKGGKVILFYTKGIYSGTYTQAEMWDLSNLDAPVKLKENKLTDGGSVEVFNNADFAYDPSTNSFYCVKEDHIAGGWYPTDGGVNWISGSVSVFYAMMGDNDALVGDSLFKANPWTKVSTVGESLTGFKRNHNAGIATDEYGWIVDGSKIPVVYTMSLLASQFPDWEAHGQWPALHTYRLHGAVIYR